MSIHRVVAVPYVPATEAEDCLICGDSEVPISTVRDLCTVKLPYAMPPVDTLLKVHGSTVMHAGCLSRYFIDDSNYQCPCCRQIVALDKSDVIMQCMYPATRRITGLFLYYASIGCKSGVQHTCRELGLEYEKRKQKQSLREEPELIAALAMYRCDEALRVILEDFFSSVIDDSAAKRVLTIIAAYGSVEALQHAALTYIAKAGISKEIPRLLVVFENALLFATQFHRVYNAEWLCKNVPKKAGTVRLAIRDLGKPGLQPVMGHEGYTLPSGSRVSGPIASWVNKQLPKLALTVGNDEEHTSKRSTYWSLRDFLSKAPNIHDDSSSDSDSDSEYDPNVNISRRSDDTVI